MLLDFLSRYLREVEATVRQAEGVYVERYDGIKEKRDIRARVLIEYLVRILVEKYSKRHKYVDIECLSFRAHSLRSV